MAVSVKVKDEDGSGSVKPLVGAIPSSERPQTLTLQPKRSHFLVSVTFAGGTKPIRG